jgi:signal transduction histidine kinase
MKRTLYVKLLLSYVLFAAAAFLVLCTFTQRQTNNTMINTESQKLYREANLLSSSYASNYFSKTLSMEELQSELEAISTYLSAQIWIVDSNGRLLLDSSDPSISANVTDTDEFSLITIPDFDIGDFGSRYYRVSNFYNYFSDDMLTVFSPITVGYSNRGYVLIHKPMSDVLKNANSFLNISFYTVGIVFLCSFVVLLVFTLVVYIPMRKITTAADSYAKGNFEKVIEVHSSDELGSMANTLNYMAKELGTLEDDQRKFVSNVSHDFRSPLTSIKGYVEAMLDGTIPVEMQEKYLNIILFETDRLNRLTQSLLDLNRFGHHGIMLEIADFDINQMIRTTIRTFEGRCNEKGITFDLVLTGQELFVTADMTKIQQVLYNLTDNAVKFSHHNSSIKIETSIKNEKVLIYVKDSGIGIPADSIKKIWDRFYKTDLSRGKDKRGTGLGLSIVKEIIQAHKENINVISTEGVGTEFIFTLPLSHKES